jgi:hypothetical protein
VRSEARIGTYVLKFAGLPSTNARAETCVNFHPFEADFIHISCVGPGVGKTGCRLPFCVQHGLVGHSQLNQGGELWVAAMPS